jgi:hypothetical protein
VTGNDIKGMTMEDTTARPPMTEPTGAVLEDPDIEPEDAEHVEPEENE